MCIYLQVLEIKYLLNIKMRHDVYCYNHNIVEHDDLSVWKSDQVAENMAKIKGKTNQG